MARTGFHLACDLIWVHGQRDGTGAKHRPRGHVPEPYTSLPAAVFMLACAAGQSCHAGVKTCHPWPERSRAPDADRPVGTGPCQPAEASLNALIAITGGLITHGPLPGDPDLHLTFLALHELRMRTITLLDQAEDRAAPP
jgi:hypothetical protein